MNIGANLGAMTADDRVVIVAIVLARLALPLLIPRIPLMILAALPAPKVRDGKGVPETAVGAQTE